MMSGGVIDSKLEAKRFPDADALARVLASEVAAHLAQGYEARGMATLVVSGGRSPVGFFEELRAQALDWRRVTIALADERWVEPTDPGSNEHLVREVLLSGNAAVAGFVGLKNGAPSPELGAAAAWEALSRLPRPFDVTILGMGIDGHTASLFPGSPGLAGALEADAAPACVAMSSPKPPYARLSLNLSALLDSRRITVLIFGEAKLRTYEKASGAGPAEEMPVRAVLRQQRVPAQIVWAPEDRV
jgi:6-phosphogluconolactonase